MTLMVKDHVPKDIAPWSE